MAEETQSQTLKAILGVRDIIFGGDVAPGDRLSEVALSRQLNLSRTPLRAALARLEQEGLLEPIPNGGYAVRRFTQDDVIDAIELRGVLEGTAARLAAERGASPARIAAFKSLVLALDEATGDSPASIDFERYVELNAEFHATLATLSGSALLQRQIERVLHLPFASPSAFINAQTDIAEFRASLFTGQAQHRAIAQAIEMREGARAEALSREHARLARQNLDVVIQNRSLLNSIPALALVAG